MVPIVFCPTNVVFVDDHPFFLEAIAETIPDPTYCVKTFVSEDQALTFIRSQKSILGDFVVGGEETDRSVRDASFSLKSLYQAFKSSDFKDEVSVVFVDYRMSDMDGVSFCKKIKDLPIKKVLLTGEADERIAVDAFNKGLIDAYLSKNTPCLSMILGEKASFFQNKFFEGWSQQWYPFVQNPLLTSSAFQKFFQSLIDRYQVTSFCFLENPCTFTMRTRDSRELVLRSFTESDFDVFLESQEAEEASLDATDALKKKTHVLCWENFLEHMVPPGALWKDHLYQADSVMIEQERIFYTLIEGLRPYPA